MMGRARLPLYPFYAIAVIACIVNVRLTWRVSPQGHLSTGRRCVGGRVKGLGKSQIKD